VFVFWHYKINFTSEFIGLVQTSLSLWFLSSKYELAVKGEPITNHLVHSPSEWNQKTLKKSPHAANIFHLSTDSQSMTFQWDTRIFNNTVLSSKPYKKYVLPIVVLNIFRKHSNSSSEKQTKKGNANLWLLLSNKGSIYTTSCIITLRRVVNTSHLASRFFDTQRVWSRSFVFIVLVIMIFVKP